MLERREVLGALVLRPGVGQRSGPGGIGQSPGDEQVDGPRELLLTRDLLRRCPAQRTQRHDVREHLLRRLAAHAPAQEREQVVQIEAGEEQVDELATPPLVEGAQVAERARQVPAERDVERALAVADGERGFDLGAIGRAREELEDCRRGRGRAASRTRPAPSSSPLRARRRVFP